MSSSAARINKTESYVEVRVGRRRQKGGAPDSSTLPRDLPAAQLSDRDREANLPTQKLIQNMAPHAGGRDTHTMKGVVWPLPQAANGGSSNKISVQIPSRSPDQS